MKSENSQFCILNNSSLGFTQHEKKESPILCEGKNEALYFCVEEDCKRNPVFICKAESCLCEKKHAECMRANIEKTLSKIRQKIIKTDQIKLQIENMFDKVIDTISDLRESLIKDVDEQMQFIGLYEAEKKLLKISKNLLEPTAIDSSETQFLSKILKEKSKVPKQPLKKFDNLLSLFEQGISQLIQEFQFLNSEIFRKFRKSTLRFPEIQKQSQTLNTPQSIQMLQSIMMPRKIKDLKLLYQASLHNFSLEKYYKTCGYETDTIIVALTDKDKIFGCYLPFCFWNGDQELDTDPQRKSFLFSISENEKYIITSNQQKDYLQGFFRDGTINFGGFFTINHNNLRNVCVINDQLNFSDKNYKGNKQLNMKLIGNETSKCSLKEWEVLKVSFEI